MFRPAYLCEDWLGVVSDERHMVFRWSEHRLFVSCCERGGAISAHFSADKEALRHIKEAIDEFCGWVFDVMPCCNMVFACIVKPSVERLVQKCGFSYLDSREGIQIYVRYKSWEAS